MDFLGALAGGWIVNRIGIFRSLLWLGLGGWLFVGTLVGNRKGWFWPLTLLAIGLGIAMVYGLMLLLQPWLESAYGLYVVIAWPSTNELLLLALIAACGFIVGLIPGVRIYRYSLADGMTIRI